MCSKGVGDWSRELSLGSGAALSSQSPPYEVFTSLPVPWLELEQTGSHRTLGGLKGLCSERPAGRSSDQLPPITFSPESSVLFRLVMHSA